MRVHVRVMVCVTVRAVVPVIVTVRMVVRVGMGRPPGMRSLFIRRMHVLA